MKWHLLTMMFVLFFCTATARAESWVFQRSYYSHDPVTHVRIGRQFTPGPVYTRPQGEYVNSGFRYNRSTINVRGQSYDNTNIYEGWYQVGAQF